MKIFDVAKQIVGLPRKAARFVMSCVERNRILAEIDFWRRRPDLLATPVNLHLEVTNRCNLSCRTCGRNYWDKSLNPLGDMSLDTARKLDPYLKRAACINVWGYGESLLSPHFFDLLDHCGQFGGAIQLFTNGTTLTESNIRKLINRNLDSLVISLDGATADTVQKTRSGLSLDDVVHKLVRLNELKAANGSNCPSLYFSFTGSEKNIHELPMVIHLAARLKVSTVFVSVARMFHSSMVQESLLNDPAAAAARFQEVQEEGRNLGVNVNLPDLLKEGCNQPFELLFVKWNGDVFGCCASAFHSSPRLQIFLGNVHELSLDSMWNGHYMRQVRNGLMARGPLCGICRSCAFYKLTLENLQKCLPNPVP